MTCRGVLLLVGLAGFTTQAHAQQPSIDRLSLRVQQGDSASLVADVRQQPADARELLGQLVMQAGRAHPTEADSLLLLARRVASAYAEAWSDSFPARNLARFERLTPGQRAAKVAADSVRLAGNAVRGTKGWRGAIVFWREALRRSQAIPDTAGMAAALGNIGAGFYYESEPDSAEAYLVRARTLAEGIGDRRPSALTRLAIGQVLQQQGSAPAARRALTQALDTLRALSDIVGEAAALGALGDLELEGGAPLAAEAHYRQAIARIRGHHVPTASWQLRAGLGRALKSRGALSESADELRLAIGDVERMAGSMTLAERRSTFLADKWEAYEALALVERERGDVAAAFAANERLRARQMLDVLSRGRVARAAATDSALVAREQDLRLRIAELTQRMEAEEGSVGTLRGPDLSGSSSGVTREAPPEADMSRIAFAAPPSGGIRVMRADGLAVQALTTVRDEWNPAWSPDGTRIAFDRGTSSELGPDIYVMNADGTGLRRLTSGTSFDANPVWSPDGRKMAFYRDGSIWVMNAADGSGATRLTDDGAHPSWSPDGARLTFWSGRSGRWGVYVMNADGSNVRRLTSDTLSASNPAWSPDGRFIAFQGDAGIYVMHADGSNIRRVAFGGQTPAWSPDSKRINRGSRRRS